MSADDQNPYPTDNKSNELDIAATPFVPSDATQDTSGISRWHIIVGLFALLALAAFWFLFTSKSVQLSFDPSADTINVRGGFSIELGGVYLLREGTYTVEATAKLHQPLEQTFSVEAPRNQRLEFTFVPLPGLLNLQLDPPDAQVIIQNRPIEERQSIILDAGPQSIEVTHPKYLPYSSIVEIQGKRIEQNLTVALAPNWADVELSSTPAGATILIDGVDSGETTPAIIPAMSGEREIALQLEGYRVHRQRLFAQAGKDMEIPTISLLQADAQLQLNSTPAGAGITLNGRFVGQTPKLLDLKSGYPHKVQLILAGYQTFTTTRTLKAGELSVLRPSLVRQTGTVVVRAQPEEAELTINGQSVGSANQSLTLPINEHTIAINLDGYAGYTQVITPKVGLTQEVKVKLLTLEEARLRSLKPSITTTAGQTLKLYQPFDFSMGASRREPGRRANETLRDVAMSRLFYIATHEVTNAQFRQFAAGHNSGKFVEQDLNEDAMPVSSVSWEEAAAYCNWLSDTEGLPRFYDIEFGKVIGTNQAATGYRLPTEAEWAWAARTQPGADAATPDPKGQLRFAWGANLPPPDRHGNYADRSASALVGRVIFGYNDNHTAAAPIGTFKPNQRGLYDLSGNVAEWINDFYEIPKSQPVTDPIGPDSGEYHVIRGSSWMHGTITELRYSFRDYGLLGRQDLGFRIARYAE